MNWANVGRSAARRVWAPGLCWAALWKQKDAASIGARDGTWALGSGCAGETPCEHGCGSGPSEAQAARSAAATGARKRDALVGVRSAAAAAGMGRRARCAKRGLGTVRDACKGALVRALGAARGARACANGGVVAVTLGCTHQDARWRRGRHGIGALPGAHVGWQIIVKRRRFSSSGAHVRVGLSMRTPALKNNITGRLMRPRNKNPVLTLRTILGK